MSEDKALMMYHSNWRIVLYGLLANLGAASALIVVNLFANSQVSIPDFRWIDLFPLPGLYFLEIGALSVIAAIVTWNRTQPQPAWQAGLPWGTAGVLLAFVILGAWTIGFFLIPAFLCFLAAGFADPNLRREQLSARLGMLLGAGLLQALLIISMVIIVSN